MRLLKREAKIGKIPHHENIVKQFEFQEETQLVEASGKETPVAYLAYEPIFGGEFFNYVVNSGDAFEEPVCRYFFLQMLKGVQHLHKNGFAHRDLKPDNMMMDITYLSD